MKRVITFVFVCVAAFAAKADWLYWQIGGEDSATDPLANVMSYANEIGKNWSQANFYRVAGDTKEQIATLVNTEYSSDQQEGPFDYATGIAKIDSSALGTAGSYSYYIELVNTATATSTLIGSQTATYDQLSGSIQTSELDMGDPAQIEKVWHGSGSYSAAPEPTSAMLMLLGVAGLALRRKQRKSAE